MAEPGTLAGIIAELKEAHPPYIPSEYENQRGGVEHRGPVFCMYCGTREDRLVWPCPTREIVQRHQRAMYRIERWGMDPAGGDPDDIAVMVDGGWVYRAKTREEAEAWIEAQVSDGE